jgi:hypothetical protein
MVMTNLGIMERARKLLNGAGQRASRQEVKNRLAAGASNAKRSNDTAQSIPVPIWMETEARVTECHHELVRSSALTLRITNDPNKLIVSFTYYAHARTYCDNFISPVAIEHGEAFSVYYNALNPSQNTRSPSDFIKRSPLSDITILGFITLSTLSLTIVCG